MNLFAKGNGDPGEMTNAQDSNLSFAGYLVDAFCKDGTFSSVYRMSGGLADAHYAVKIANELDDAREPSDLFPTRAWYRDGDRFSEGHPDPSDVIARQYARAIGIECSGWVKIEEVRNEDGRSVAVMDWVEAPSLKSLMDCASYSLEILVDIARTLSILIDTGLIDYHGDLRPGNVLIDVDQAKIIDPGYFGPVRVYFDEEVEMAITTWQYYPMLRPNDMFAFGMMGLELCTGVHPFHPALGLDKSASRFGPLLQEYLNDESKFNQFIGNLECLPDFLDRFGGSISTELKAILLRCLGMEILEDGSFELTSSYSTFAALSDELSAIELPELDFSQIAANQRIIDQKRDSN